MLIYPESEGTFHQRPALEFIFDDEIPKLDRYGRTIGDVYSKAGTLLNKALVENRLAWHYKHYFSDQELAQAEINARKNNLICGWMQNGWLFGILGSSEHLIINSSLGQF